MIILKSTKVEPTFQPLEPVGDGASGVIYQFQRTDLDSKPKCTFWSMDKTGKVVRHILGPDFKDHFPVDGTGRIVVS